MPRAIHYPPSTFGRGLNGPLASSGIIWFIWAPKRYIFLFIYLFFTIIAHFPQFLIIFWRFFMFFPQFIIYFSHFFTQLSYFLLFTCFPPQMSHILSFWGYISIFPCFLYILCIKPTRFLGCVKRKNEKYNSFSSGVGNVRSSPVGGKGVSESVSVYPALWGARCVVREGASF